MSVLREGILERNPAWVQLLGLCPLLAVSSSVATALGLAMASAFVLVASNVTISLLRGAIPHFARLPVFVLIIATTTTIATLVLEAYAYDLYARIALFVQIIVTNCMILARAESFASQTGPANALYDAIGTAIGFAIALLTLGAARELLGSGTLLANMDQLFGPAAAAWRVDVVPQAWSLLAVRLPPGAFIVAGLLLAVGQAIRNRRQRPASGTQEDRS